MTKKVISFFVLIVSLVICTANLYADYAGLTNKEFDLVLTRYEANYVKVTAQQLDDNHTEITEANPMTVDTTQKIAKTQCRIVVNTNYDPKIKVTFDLFKNTTNDSYKIPYKVSVFKTNESDVHFTLNVQKDASSGSFTAGTTPTSNKATAAKDYYYLMGFEFESSAFDNIIVGDYEATIKIEVTDK